MQENIPSNSRRLPIGAELIPEKGVSFRLWAPKCQKVEVVFADGGSTELRPEEGGHFSGIAKAARAGSRYQFRLDGKEKLFPDPASRYQPDGVHGWSQVVDPFAYKWTDSNWKGIGPIGQVLYELHVGTFTPEGTWAGAIGKLNYLKELGVTCLEVMPIAEFPGKFGWGYDGVDLFAPTRLYGTPDDFRRFIDAAHACGIAVILDVVYNHIGPDGNYLKEFADHYFTKKHGNDWGESLNFDDDGAAGVREYFVTNARCWISEYHLDGFRFDATHAILDESQEHVLAEISRAARHAAGDRSIYLVAENEPQQTRLVRLHNKGGYGMDALWNDDFHHSAMVALTGRNEAYFTDYLGHPQEFVSAFKWGYLFQGQFNAWQMKRRGTSALDLHPAAFVNYIQNHDQIANYGHGERAQQLSSLAQLKAMTVLLLLAPQTPMLFQGQEFSASSPFNYFADHTGDLPGLIRKGRLKELSQFPSNAHPDMQACMPDPSDEKTFQRCKLDWSQINKGWHEKMLALHKQLLTFRRTDPVLSRVNEKVQVDGAVVGHDAFVLRFFSEEGDRILVINLGSDMRQRVNPEPLLAPPIDMRWDVMLSTEAPQYGGSGISPLETAGEDWRLPGINWQLPGRCALLLKPMQLTDAEKANLDRVEKEREAHRQNGMAAG